MKTFLLSIVFLIASLFSGCSSGSVSDVVCDYGTVVCDISQTLCSEIPGVPVQVCDYLNLACYNLDVLCSMPSESIEYKEAVMSLQFIGEKLKSYKYSIKNK